jgi:hypothetical protein
MERIGRKRGERREERGSIGFEEEDVKQFVVNPEASRRTGRTAFFFFFGMAVRRGKTD